MRFMDLISRSAAAPHVRPGDRGRRLVRVKFVALPMEAAAPARRFSLRAFFSRVIDRLAAARP
jgi:hypothetical protein